MRVRMTLEEKQIEYTVIEENLSEFSKELLEAHPQARVPLLIAHWAPSESSPHSMAIYESSIITEFVDETFTDKPLMPKDAGDRAKVRLLTYWCDQIFKPDLDLYKYELKNLTSEEFAQLRVRLNSHLRKIETELSESQGNFLIGQSITLADIHLFPLFRQFKRATPVFSDLSHYSQLNHWLESILARPSFERVMNKNLKV